MISPFSKGYIFTKFRAHMTLAKISEFTVRVTFLHTQ